MFNVIKSVFFAVIFLLIAGQAYSAQLTLKDGRPFCSRYECKSIIPWADKFRQADELNIPVLEALRNNKVIGYLFLSTDLVDIPAYSGKPLVTLIAIAPDGMIIGGKVVHHSEPILLVGIPESVLNEFIEQYIGYSITDHFEIVSTGFFGDRGQTTDTIKSGSIDHGDKLATVEIDMVTGATVTIQVLDQTLITSARQVGQALSLIEEDNKRIVTWKSDYVQKTWAELVDEGSIGHLRVETEEMGITDENSESWIDLYYGDVSQPVTGINILGESTYNWLKENLQEGEKAIFVVSNGISSFKGSGFVRGGIFDRFYIEQGNSKITFRDLDYENLYGINAEGVPKFRETGLFIVRDKLFDSSNKWNFYYVANRLTGETALSKIFKTFHSEYQYPDEYFDLKVIHAVQPSFVKKVWVNNLPKVILLISFLLITFGIFFARKWLTRSKKRLVRVHIAVMIASVIIVGLILKSPPSITHLYPLIRVFHDGFRMDLYLSDPVQFVFWIFIAVSLIIWGRGWFCGWICPYGNVLELVSKAVRKISPKMFTYEFPPHIHEGLRKVRYAVLGVLVGMAMISIETAEKMAEIEPFKSTWLVNIFSREWYFIGYWFILLIISTFNFRFFCRYLCPLGAAFSLGSVFRFIGIERRGCCTQCKVCARGCESKAINDEGEINKYECLYCLECEQIYNDDEACPPLIVVKKNKLNGIPVDLTHPCKNPDL